MTTGDIYSRYHETLWRRWNERRQARLRSAYPQTGGQEIYVHNWIVCDRRNPERSAQATAMLAAGWAEWRRISARGEREYARVEHGSHGPQFRPLWCDYCKAN